MNKINVKNALKNANNVKDNLITVLFALKFKILEFKILQIVNVKRGFMKIKITKNVKGVVLYVLLVKITINALNV